MSPGAPLGRNIFSPGATYSRSGNTSNGRDRASATMVPRPFCWANATGSSNLGYVSNRSIVAAADDEPWQPDKSDFEEELASLANGNVGEHEIDTSPSLEIA